MDDDGGGFDLDMFTSNVDWEEECFAFKDVQVQLKFVHGSYQVSWSSAQEW